MSGGESDLLRGLSPDDLNEALLLAEPGHFTAGEVIFEMGDPATKLYLVQEGRVDLTLPMTVGGKREDVTVEDRMPGQMLGWSALVPPYRFTLRAAAATETKVQAFSRDDLEGLFASRPEVGLLVMTNVAAIVGHRFQVFQTMWLRQMQRVVEMKDG
jgi:CRP-like cAMP-binding protein